MILLLSNIEIRLPTICQRTFDENYAEIHLWGLKKSSNTKIGLKSHLSQGYRTFQWSY